MNISKNNLLITCVPKLNMEQEEGMLSLIDYYSKQGYQVLFWSDHSYNLLKQFSIDLSLKKLSFIEKANICIDFLKINYYLNKNKWRDRLKVWLNKGSDEEVESFIKQK